MKRIVLALFVIASSVEPENGRAFWSDPFYGTHQDITKTALSQPDPRTGMPPFCFSGNCYYFSDKAVALINFRHLIQDSVAYDANDHFDANHFVGGLQKMATNRSALNSLLKQQPYSAALQAKMWVLMGNMLHAAEDFYAHSTWVDEGATSIIDFGTATENNPPDFSIFPVPAGLQYCGSDGFPLSRQPVNYLITGYYPPDTIVPPAGQCLHGATFPTFYSVLQSDPTASLFGLCKSDLANSLQTVPGISHDVACSGNFSPANTQQLHDACLWFGGQRGPVVCTGYC
jgi:hypothetical protein